MSGVVSDPNTLTKDKLKRELAKHNVSLPSADSRKDVYVGLYRQHVLAQQKGPTDSKHFDFSSDDDGEISIKGKTKKGKQPSPKKSRIKKGSTEQLDTMDVPSLSDSELIRMLKKYNIAYGPIVDSTRRVYQKKLQKLMAQGPPGEIPLISNTADTVDDYSDQEDESEPEPEPEPVVTRTRTVERREVRQRSTREQPKYDEPDHVSHRTAPREEPREPLAGYSRSSTTTRTTTSSSRVYTTPQDDGTTFSASDIITQAEEIPPETPKKRGLSIWMQLIIVCIVAFLIFLVFQNMEPAGKAPIRQLDHEEV